MQYFTEGNFILWLIDINSIDFCNRSHTKNETKSFHEISVRFCLRLAVSPPQKECSCFNNKQLQKKYLSHSMIVAKCSDKSEA